MLEPLLMLKHLNVRNFKCFKETTFIDFGQINLLTGINGNGKSTALQTLLLMRQSIEHSQTTDKLVFNGSCLELGNFDDVRNAEKSRVEDIVLEFRFGNNQGDWICINYEFEEDETDELGAQVRQINLEASERNVNKPALNVERQNGVYVLRVSSEKESVFLHKFLFDSDSVPKEHLDFIKRNVNFTNIHYVSADRIGPKDYYPKQSFTEFPNVGKLGEFAPNILESKQNDRVAEAICLETGETHTLLDQTNAWLSRIFDGARVELTPTEANIVLMSLNSEDTSSAFKPINVGFGYSYALPIIVAGLIAKRGEILIVENPEAHLHPYAQSQITKFLAEISSMGVQVFIESHSDHVLNALRICVIDDILLADDLNVLYFGKGTQPEVTRIPVQENGAIEVWPKGFFDQIDKDFSRLFGL